MTIRHVMLPIVSVTAIALGSALFAQSGKLTDQDFGRLARSHSTAEEHQRLAAHYNAHAQEHEVDAKEHEALGALYDKSEPSLAGEIRHYAAHSREAAEALRAIAKIHQGLAKDHSAKK
jgi:hypothetical protein